MNKSVYDAPDQISEIKRHILTVLVDNEPGVLARVIGMFSGRGYNIDSLNVAVDGTNVASFLLDDAMEISDKGTTIYDKSIVDFNHVLPSVVKLFIGTAKSRNITFRTEQPFNEATFIYIYALSRAIAFVLPSWPKQLLSIILRCPAQ